MKKTMGIVVFLVVVAVIIVAATLIINAVREAECRKYEEVIGGYTYKGYDSAALAQSGKIGYHYDLTLNEDKTCTLKFKAIRTGSKDRWTENGTATSFELTGMTWSVRHNGSGYEIFLAGGDWDWQGWSAAMISRSIKILHYDGYDLMFKGLRSGYYEFHFQK